MPAKPRHAASARGAVKVDPRKIYCVLVGIGPQETVGNLREVDLDHACMPQPPRDARSRYALT